VVVHTQALVVVLIPAPAVELIPVRVAVHTQALVEVLIPVPAVELIPVRAAEHTQALVVELIPVRVGDATADPVEETLTSGTALIRTVSEHQ
jgi:hypothetical protein